MSASVQPLLFAIDGGRAVLSVDRAVLRRLRHSFDLLPSGALEVLDDEDGAVVRFLCRAGRMDFLQSEVFVATAVRRFFDKVEDRRLACMMYVDALSQELRGERVSWAVLRQRLQSLLLEDVPPAWFACLRDARPDQTLLLQSEPGRLELISRTRDRWVYGLLET